MLSEAIREAPTEKVSSGHMLKDELVFTGGTQVFQVEERVGRKSPCPLTDARV